MRMATSGFGTVGYLKTCPVSTVPPTAWNFELCEIGQLRAAFVFTISLWSEKALVTLS